MVVKFQWKASILAGPSSAKHPQILLLAALLQRGDQGGGQLQGQGGGGSDRGGDGGQPQDRDRGYFHSEILSDSKKYCLKQHEPLCCPKKGEFKL